MFETEAKEWADKKYPCDGQAQRYLLMGANFGYNKANRELAEYVLNHDLDDVLAKCEEILNGEEEEEID